MFRSFLPCGEHQRAQTAEVSRRVCDGACGPAGHRLSVEGGAGSPRQHCVHAHRTAEGCVHQPAAEGPGACSVHPDVHEQTPLEPHEPAAVQAWRDREGIAGNSARAQD